MPGAFFAPADPPRGVLRIAGEDRVAFLQGLVSNDVRTVDEAHGIWTAMLTPQGKYLFDFFVTSDGSALLLEGEGARIADLQRRLSMFKLRAKVVITDVSATLTLWHVWGDGAAASLGLKAPGEVRVVDGGIALADPRIASLGLRILLPSGTGAPFLTKAGFTETRFADWDRLRITEGVPDGTRDLIIEKSILLENGFDELHGVAWDKGCYVGQELTARTKYRGLIKKRLMPVMFDGPAPAPGTIIVGADGSEVGEVRGGQDGIALAVVRLDAVKDGIELTADGMRVEPALPGWSGLGPLSQTGLA
jgi:folate-binding protein YgfZ